MNFNYPKTILSTMSKSNYINTINDFNLNPLEVELDGLNKAYVLKLINVYPVYFFEERKHICYRKRLKEKEKLFLIKEHMNAPNYTWKDNAYQNIISLYHFIDMRKGQEFWASYILKDANKAWWDTRGVLEDGTILSSCETRKIVDLLYIDTIENIIPYDSYEIMSEEECECRDLYHKTLIEGGF